MSATARWSSTIANGVSAGALAGLGIAVQTRPEGAGLQGNPFGIKSLNAGTSFLETRAGRGVYYDISCARNLHPSHPNLIIPPFGAIPLERHEEQRSLVQFTSYMKRNISPKTIDLVVGGIAGLILACFAIANWPLISSMIYDFFR